MRKCINCIWQGDEELDVLNHCPVCGDNTEGDEPKPKPEKKDAGILDINKDGKVDKEDVKAAASVLRKVGSRLKGKRGKRR